MNFRPGLVCFAALFFSLLSFSPSISFSQRSDPAPADIIAGEDIFPIGVWLQDPGNARSFKALGINFFAGLWKGPTERQLSQLQAAGMPVFAAQNDLALMPRYKDVIIGWMMPDEPDNTQTGADGSKKPPVMPEALIAQYHQMKERDPVRPILLNLGQGVAWDQWHGRGTRTNHQEDYELYVKAADIVSFDIYPITHRDSGIRGRLDYVARGVDRLVNWTDRSKPVWSLIETSRVSTAEIMPTGDQIRSLVWLSIIHGARGIIYFVHQFSPYFVEASLLENEALSQEVATINARLQSLAPILNNENVARVDIDVTAPYGSVSILTRQDGCHLYVFSGSVSKFATDAQITIDGDIAKANVDVLDESRQIELRGGRFQDSFAPYAIHLYRIALKGDGCG
ncbi:hypothetical protein [uncultured Sneathiella sp.]|uniref:hypothetical protein n=1 Tax=uncultured Sneathiella sp. TaxID=879315 RepID=UPI0030EF8EB9|tara:strand:+ start:51022 stop:52212 length:1191 start_codon:yes stop_codon:yes gene_type:complete